VTTEQQALLGDEHDRHTARLRQHEADFTPYHVAEQPLLYLRDKLGFTPRAVIDPSAGAGVYCKAVRTVWPRADVYAIEPREEEHVHLQRWAHIASASTLQEWMADVADHYRGAFDLMSTNPPFTMMADFAAAGRELGCEKTLLLGTNDWFQRGEEKLETARTLGLLEALSRQLLIPGAIDFRGGAINPRNGKPFGADAKSYSNWLWDLHACTPEGERWVVEVLPRLCGQQRKWRGQRPGAEAA
jgi:hypothetical protein